MKPSAFSHTQVRLPCLAARFLCSFHASITYCTLDRCIGKNPHTPVVLLSLKSLGYLLHWDLPSMQRCAPIMGRHVLARLVQGGVGGIRGEMGQACFKALSMLFKSQVHVFGISVNEEGGAGERAGDSGGAGARAGAGGGGEAGGRRRKAGNLFGLSPKQLRALLVVLQMAVAETEHQNATFTLIKAVVSRKVMLPEVRVSKTVCCCFSRASVWRFCRTLASS